MELEKLIQKNSKQSYNHLDSIVKISIYQLISDLDTPDAERNGSISFDDFVDSINYKLGVKESKEGIRRIFGLFIDDPNADTITLIFLKKNT